LNEDTCQWELSGSSG